MLEDYGQLSQPVTSWIKFIIITEYTQRIIRCDDAQQKGYTMKYIMFEDFSGEALPILFPNRIGFLEFREQIPYTKVLSAGYVQIRPDGISCHGESKELNSASSPEDSGIICEKLDGVES